MGVQADSTSNRPDRVAEPQENILMAAPDLLSQYRTVQSSLTQENSSNSSTDFLIGFSLYKLNGEGEAVTISDGQAPSDRAKPRVDQRVAEAQKLLLQMAPNLWKAADSGMALGLPAQPEERKQLEERFHREQEQGVFGTASQTIYAALVKFLEVMPVITAQSMQSAGMEVPPGGFSLGTTDGGTPMSPDLAKTRLVLGGTSLSLPFDTSRPPTPEERSRMDDMLGWLVQCTGLLEQRQVLDSVALLTRQIIDKNNGYPQSWLPRDGDDKPAWSQAARYMINLSCRTRDCVEVMKELAKRAPDYKPELPPNSTVVVDYKGKRFEITNENISDPMMLRAFKDGTIKSVDLDLPRDLQLDRPENLSRVEALRAWTDRVGPFLSRNSQFIQELLSQDPTRLIMYGDVPLSKPQGRFSAQGEFLGLATPGYKPQNGEVVKDVKLLFDASDRHVGFVPSDYQPKSGEVLKDVNMLSFDFQARLVTEDGPNKGKVEITQTCDLCSVPFYAYQDARVPGFKQGRVPTQPIYVNPEDFLPVMSGGEMRLVRAQDATRFRDSEKGWYYGQKALVGTLDGLLIATGLIELRLAASAGRLAVGEVTSAALARRAMVHLTVGATGVFNNAGAESTTWGAAINKARTAYFTVDIMRGLYRPGWLPGKRQAKLVESAFEQTAQESSAWVRAPYTTSKYGFKASEGGLLLVGAKDLKEALASDARANLPLLGDGRGMLPATRESLDRGKPENVRDTRAVLSDYARLMAAKSGPETQPRVKEIFDRTSRLMGPEATDQERQAYAKELVAKLLFTPDELRQLEKAFPAATSDRGFRLSAQQAADLLDPEKRKSFPPEVQREAARILAGKDQAVRAAASTCLVFLLRNPDGSLPDQTEPIRLTIPAYERSVLEPRETATERGVRSRVTTQIPERLIEVSLSAGQLIDGLKRETQTAGADERRVAAGDLLCRLGVMSHRQYGAMLQQILSSPNTSAELKKECLLSSTGARFATVIDGLISDEREGQPGDAGRYGSSSQDFLRTLEKTAREEKDPEVRALACGLIYALSQSNPASRRAMLSIVNDMTGDSAKRGKFGEVLSLHLLQQLVTPVPDNDTAGGVIEQRLAAVRALELLYPGRADMQRECDDAVLGCLSSNDLRATAMALDLLTPERLARLQQTNPAMLDAARMHLIGLIGKPANESDTSSQVQIMRRLPDVLKDSRSAYRAALEARLQAVLAPNSAAGKFPDMRAATLELCAQMGFSSDETFRLIRSHATSAENVSFGNSKIPAGENSAAVRSAALKALVQLNAVGLRELAEELIPTEKDPQVAIELRSIRSRTERVEEGSPEYERKSEQQSLVLNMPWEKRPEFVGKYKYLADFSVEKPELIMSWFKDNGFGLLNPNTFVSNVTERSGGYFPFKTPWWMWEKDGEQLRQKAYRDMKVSFYQRQSQMFALCELALRSGENSDKAKCALYAIIINPGLLGPEGSVTINGAPVYEENVPKAMQAARALRMCATEGESKDLTAALISLALANNAVPANVREELLGGWMALKTVSTERKAVVLLAALQAENAKLPTDQSPQLQERLIRELGGLGYAKAAPELATIARQSSNPVVRFAAQSALEQVQDSYQETTSRTPYDTDSTPDARAQRVREALSVLKEPLDVVKEIARSYRNYRISSEKDPAMPVLKDALKHPDARVRLAAAEVVMSSNLDRDCVTMRQALAECAYIATDTLKAGVRKDAIDLLCQFGLDKPIVSPGLNGRELVIKRDSGSTIVEERMGGRVVSVVLACGIRYDAEPGKAVDIVPGKNGCGLMVYDDKKQLILISAMDSTWVRQKRDGAYINEWIDMRTGLLARDIAP